MSSANKKNKKPYNPSNKVKQNSKSGKSKRETASKKSDNKDTVKENKGVRLNKYIANAGVCSRREADKLISEGAIKINGEVVDKLGSRVYPEDKVYYKGKVLKSENKIYLLLNKPKDYITTTDDPQERKTVMHIIGDACDERVYPVGRLDRNSTGVLLLTNDGELAKKLTHPKHGVKKLYHVMLDKDINKSDMAKITKGVNLSDGFVAADNIAYVGSGLTKNEVGIEIHSGQNRVVRRMFEKLGYKVEKLDRVMFAGLTKKNLRKGRYRFLTDKEVSFLKMTS